MTLNKTKSRHFRHTGDYIIIKSNIPISTLAHNELHKHPLPFGGPWNHTEGGPCPQPNLSPGPNSLFPPLEFLLRKQGDLYPQKYFPCASNFTASWKEATIPILQRKDTFPRQSLYSFLSVEVFPK